jgi:hypothetical protein
VVVVVVVSLETWIRAGELLVPLPSKVVGILAPIEEFVHGRCFLAREEEVPLHRIECGFQMKLALWCSPDELRRGCGGPNDNVRSCIGLRTAIISSIIIRTRRMDYGDQRAMQSSEAFPQGTVQLAMIKLQQD